MEQKRLVIGISGASGAIYGIRLLEVLAERPEVETHLVITQTARLVITQETDRTVAQIEALADCAHAPGDLTASIASGSFATRGMVIAPCSIKMLSAVANSYAADASAAVALARAQLEAGGRPSQVAKEVARRLGIPRNRAYQIIQEIRGGDEGA